MVTLGGRQVKLVEGKANKKLALTQFYGLKAITPKVTSSPTARVCGVFESFLAVCRPRLTAETMRNYDWYGQSFSER